MNTFTDEMLVDLYTSLQKFKKSYNCTDFEFCSPLKNDSADISIRMKGSDNMYCADVNFHDNKISIFFKNDCNPHLYSPFSEAIITGLKPFYSNIRIEYENNHLN